MLGAITTVVKLDLDLQQTSQLLVEFQTVYRVKWSLALLVVRPPPWL